jgi:hypothetical protein
MARKPQGKDAPAPADQVVEGAEVEVAPEAGKAEDADEVLPVVEGEGEPLAPVEENAEGVVTEERTAGEDTPPPSPPGDDPESVFARRIARLERIVDEAEFESGTAFGDMRDTILDLFKHRPKLWSAMSAGEQQDLVRAVEALGKRILGKVVLVIAQEESDTIEGTLLGQFNVKGETIEAKLKIEHADPDVLNDVFRMAGHKIVIVSADDKRFMSARKPPVIEPDQLGMAFAGDAKSPAPGPVESTPSGGEEVALADGADPESAVDKAKRAADPDDAFGVFDTDSKKWLAGEEDDAGWTVDVGEAVTWPHARATELAAEFESDGVVARRIGG